MAKDIEEVRVKWDPLADSLGEQAYRVGTDQNGRTVEVNKHKVKDSTIHIDGVLRYSCWTKTRDPVAVLKRLTELHSFVVLDA
jgi:hypothetical protein